MQGTATQRELTAVQANSTWTREDRAVLACVEGALAAGVGLLRWWRQTHAANAYAHRFDLIRTFNQPDTSFGFFDQAPLRHGKIPVMGIVEEMLYDQPKHAGPET